MKKAADNDLKGIINEAEESLASLHEQRGHATRVLDATLEEIRDESGQRIDEAIRQRLDEGVTPERVGDEVKARITDAVLRERIEAVLMLDANGQIVAEYAHAGAKDLDQASIERLIRLLDDIIQSWRAAERGGGDMGWWRKAEGALHQVTLV